MSQDRMDTTPGGLIYEPDVDGHVNNAVIAAEQLATEHTEAAGFGGEWTMPSGRCGSTARTTYRARGR